MEISISNHIVSSCTIYKGVTTTLYKDKVNSCLHWHPLIYAYQDVWDRYMLPGQVHTSGPEMWWSSLEILPRDVMVKCRDLAQRCDGQVLRSCTEMWWSSVEILPRDVLVKCQDFAQRCDGQVSISCPEMWCQVHKSGPDMYWSSDQIVTYN